MSNLKNIWIGKSLNELTQYYSNSNLKIPRGIDLKSTLYGVVKTAQQKKVVNLKDTDGEVDSLYLRDAGHYFNKLIYVTLCYKNLQMGGYFSWSEVTKYYIKFYNNIVLTRLQGHALMHGSKGRVELIRTNWSDHIYTIHKGKTPGGFHTYIWDITREYYKKFKQDNKITTSNEDIRAMFDDDFYRKFPGLEDLPIRREDLEHREEYTYTAAGFDELYYTDVSWAPVNRVTSEGKMNFMDDDVFKEVTNVEDYDGTGLEEAMLGSVIKFTMELIGHISDAIPGKYNPIHFKNSLFKKLKTNDDTYKMLYNLAIENNIDIT